MINQTPTKRILSDRYQHVSTGEVLADLEDRGLVNAETTSYKWKRSGTQHVARVDVGDKVTLFDTEVQPQLVIFNSFQGESALRAHLGFFRAVCANGMVVGQGITEPVIIRHIKGPTFDTKYQEFFDNLEVVLERGLVGLQERTEQPLTLSQMNALIERLTSLTGVRARDKAREILRSREEDQTGNVWQLWNVTNEAMRITARSPVAYEERNAKLLDTILREVA